MLLLPLGLPRPDAFLKARRKRLGLVDEPIDVPVELAYRPVEPVDVALATAGEAAGAFGRRMGRMAWVSGPSACSRAGSVRTVDLEVFQGARAKEVQK